MNTSQWAIVALVLSALFVGACADPLDNDAVVIIAEGEPADFTAETFSPYAQAVPIEIPRFILPNVEDMSLEETLDSSNPNVLEEDSEPFVLHPWMEGLVAPLPEIDMLELKDWPEVDPQDPNPRPCWWYTDRDDDDEPELYFRYPVYQVDPPEWAERENAICVYEPLHRSDPCATVNNDSCSFMDMALTITGAARAAHRGVSVYVVTVPANTMNVAVYARAEGLADSPVFIRVPREAGCNRVPTYPIGIILVNEMSGSVLSSLDHYESLTITMGGEEFELELSSLPTSMLDADLYLPRGRAHQFVSPIDDGFCPDPATIGFCERHSPYPNEEPGLFYGDYCVDGVNGSRYGRTDGMGRMFEPCYPDMYIPSPFNRLPFNPGCGPMTGDVEKRFCVRGGTERREGIFWTEEFSCSDTPGS